MKTDKEKDNQPSESDNEGPMSKAFWLTMQGEIDHYNENIADVYGLQRVSIEQFKKKEKVKG